MGYRNLKQHGNKELCIHARSGARGIIGKSLCRLGGLVAQVKTGAMSRMDSGVK